MRIYENEMRITDECIKNNAKNSILNKENPKQMYSIKQACSLCNHTKEVVNIFNSEDEVKTYMGTTLGNCPECGGEDCFEPISYKMIKG